MRCSLSLFEVVTPFEVAVSMRSNGKIESTGLQVTVMFECLQTWDLRKKPRLRMLVDCKDELDNIGSNETSTA